MLQRIMPPVSKRSSSHSIIRLRSLVGSTFATAAFAFSSTRHTASCFSVAAKNAAIVAPPVTFVRGGSLHHQQFSTGSSNSIVRDPNTKNIHRTISEKSLTCRQMSGATTTEKAMETTEDGVTSPPESRDAKLDALRAKMEEAGVDAYLVPSDDPHLSEYVPTAYMRRAFLSGFKGSAGTALVTKDEAFLWTDSRYFNEATLQLNAAHWKLMKIGQPKVPTISKFLSELATKKFKDTKTVFRVGIDPFVHAAAFAKELTDAFKAATDDLDEPLASASSDDGSSVDGTPSSIAEIATLDTNLVDEIWGAERPPVPTSPFRVHPLKYAGMSVTEKVEKIRKEMKEKKATLCVFPALDDVAYLLNVRATGDVESNPVGIAYATVSMDGVILYCDEKKVQAEDVKEHLASAGVTIKPYDDVVNDIEDHCSELGRKVWIDKSRANYALVRVIPEKRLIDAQTAVTAMKACKNEAEMEGMRQAHIVDGVAMAYFISWLEQAIAVEGRTVSEVEIDERLTGERAKQPGFIEVSFPTIAGVGSNGAIVHYRAQEGTDLMKYLDKDTPILIDSGGQYEYGTTDVTRTWHFGTPTPEFVDYYTRVLKGNIGVDTMIFPENTPGFVLDVFARKSLWEVGKDYGHGTGHGVGAALNVHEGPHSISPRWANKEVLKKGMIVSNEPGYYEDGNFGIRIENLLEILYVKDEYNRESDEESEEITNGESKNSSEKKFLKFKSLTLIPVQKNLINLDMMSDAELDWLDSYHELVFDTIGPLLEEGSPAKAWLKKSCEKIERKSR